jgi:hypothetical protein
MKRRSIKQRCANPQSQCGQSAIEYVLVCAAFALALGIGLADDSVVRDIVNLFKVAYEKFTHAISLPG